MKIKTKVILPIILIGIIINLIVLIGTTVVGKIQHRVPPNTGFCGLCH